jgi:hypothetical protein
LSDDARWACLEESMARSLTVISLLLQSTTHCRYRMYTKFLLTYTAIYRRNRKVLPLGITALQTQSHFHLGKPYILVQFYESIVGFPPMTLSQRQERRKNQNSWRFILSLCLLNHGLGLPQQNKKWFDWYFFKYQLYFLYALFIKLKLCQNVKKIYFKL